MLIIIIRYSAYIPKAKIQKLMGSKLCIVFNIESCLTPKSSYNCQLQLSTIITYTSICSFTKEGGFMRNCLYCV